MKNLCTLTTLMDPNGCAVMAARSVFTSPVLLVTQNNRWNQGGGISVHIQPVQKRIKGMTSNSLLPMVARGNHW